VAASIIVKNGKIQAVKIALGAVAPTVIRAVRTEDFLKGKELSEDIINKAAVLVKEEARPIDDIRSIAVYRKEMVGVLMTRGLNSIAENA